MGAREELEQLRKSQGGLKKTPRQELEELRKSQKNSILGNVNSFIKDKAKALENPSSFANALQTSALRIQQLGNKLPGSNAQDTVELDKELAAREKLPGGSGGVFLGDTVATLPFAAVSKTIQAAKPLVAGSKLGGALTGRTAQAGAEGAAIGGLLNDSPVEGAGVSVLVNALARGGGKLLKGPITKSDEANSLQQVAAAEGMPLQLPAGVAAKSPLVRKAFGDVLPSLPGAQRAMANQKKNLQSQLDDLSSARGVPPQSTESLLGADIRTPGQLENRMAWGLASATGLAPKVIPTARALSSAPVNKALLGDYKIQKKLGELGKKIRPITEALRRVVTLEGTEDE